MVVLNAVNWSLVTNGNVLDRIDLTDLRDNYIDYRYIIIKINIMGCGYREGLLTLQHSQKQQHNKSQTGPILYCP